MRGFQQFRASPHPSRGQIPSSVPGSVMVPPADQAGGPATVTAGLVVAVEAGQEHWPVAELAIKIPSRAASNGIRIEQSLSPPPPLVKRGDLARLLAWRGAWRLRGLLVAVAGWCYKAAPPAADRPVPSTAGEQVARSARACRSPDRAVRVRWAVRSGLLPSLVMMFVTVGPAPVACPAAGLPRAALREHAARDPRVGVHA